MSELLLLILLTCQDADNCVSGKHGDHYYIAMNKANEVSRTWEAETYWVVPTAEKGVVIYRVEDSEDSE